MNKDSGDDRHYQGRLRWAAVVAVLAGTTLVAAACSGGPHSTAATPAQDVTQQLDAFAQCMRGHGESNFYLSNPNSSPDPSATVLSIMGHQVIGINPQTAQFASALNSCKHLLPGGGGQPVTQKQLDNMVKYSACMRAHGFPGYPDPQRGPNGGVEEQPLPAGIDTSSPQFQAAEQACSKG